MDPSGPAPQHPVSSLEYKMSLIASSDVSLEDEDAAVAGPSKQAAIKLAYLKNALASRNTAADSINRADLRKALQQSCPSCPEAEALHQIALQLLAQTP